MNKEELIIHAYVPLAKLANKFSSMGCEEFEMELPQGRWYFLGSGNKNPKSPYKRLFLGEDGLVRDKIIKFLNQNQQSFQNSYTIPIQQKPAPQPEKLEWHEAPLTSLVEKYGKEKVEILAKKMNVVCDWDRNIIYKLNKKNE